LPICVVAKWFCGSRLVYDTNELETETVMSKGLRRVVARVIERALIRSADAVVVVGDEIGNWYRRAYGIRRLHVIRNVPEGVQGVPRRPTLLQDACGLTDRDQVFLYQGVIAPGRGVELLLEAFRRLSAHQHLVFLGYGELSDLVREQARRYPNVHHVPAVAPDVLPLYTMSAHVGLAVIENVCQSYYYCLPNKFFQYLQAGLPVIASDFPEMAAVIDRHRCGWKVRVSVEDVARQIRAITDDELAEKTRAALACRGLFTWEREYSRLRDLYRQIFPTRIGQEEREHVQREAA
jgi:glycosyltransferase involved in cell wall biosynthesis